MVEFFYLWARESVKICSEAKYFHNKPPAMRVRDKKLIAKKSFPRRCTIRLFKSIA